MATTLKYPTSTNCVQKTLDAALLAGVTAAVTLNNVVGIQNKAGVFVVDRVDANGTATPSKREYIVFTGVSGSTLTTLTRNADGGGTDQDHAVGAIVEFVSDVLQEQAIIDALLLTVTTAGALDTTKVVDLTTAQTLTNKTLTSPVINNGVFTGGGALSSKIITATRDMTAESGDVAYTGVGFKPTSLIALCALGVNFSFSIGMSDSSKTVNNMNEYITETVSVGSTLIGAYAAADASAYQTAIVKTYDADGFTLTWTKAGLPTGTANMVFMCFR